MSGDTHNRGDLRPDQQTTAYDPELARQARQAENRSGGQEGGGLEPEDSRNVTGVSGAGTGVPGGADQQDGMARWSGDADQAGDVAASQPDATTAAGQQPGIDRREIEAERQMARAEVWSGDAQPNPAASIEPSPEAEHMASAHVPGFDQQGASPQLTGAARQQDTTVPQHGQASMKQTLNGMSQSLGDKPSQQGFVDQQSASLGGADQQNQSMGGAGQMEASMSGTSGGQAGEGQDFDDGQIAATHGIDVAAEQPGARPAGAYDEQAQFKAGAASASGGQGGGSPADQIREHMEVVGADEVHLGTVDKVEGGRIKLTKADSGMGSHQGHHHYISCGLVAAVEGNRVRLSATAANAYAMEEEQ